MPKLSEKQLLFILAAVQFCHILDFMIIMPLGKTLMEALDIIPRQFAWIVSIYALMAAIAGLVSTAFIDRFDRRSALLVLYTGFIIGTFACALAPTYAFFMVARGLTGCFGGTLSALVLAIVGDVVPLERRAGAMGWVMTAFSAASVIGIPSAIYLAGWGGWPTPFFVVGGISVLVISTIPFLLPPLRGHLEREDIVMPQPDLALGVVDEPAVPRRVNPSVIETFRRIFSDPNQRAALLFTFVLMLGHFSIIPFIAPYMQLNVGFSDIQVGYIYLIGGLLSVVLLPLFGKIADRFGRFRVFAVSSFFALFSIYALTNLGPVSIVTALVVTSSFFIVAGGRSVPATTLITSVVPARSRGSFMSIRQSTNELALAASSFVAGFIITELPDGSLQHYDWVGWFTIGMSLLAVYVGSRLKEVA